MSYIQYELTTLILSVGIICVYKPVRDYWKIRILNKRYLYYGDIMAATLTIFSAFMPIYNIGAAIVCFVIAITEINPKLNNPLYKNKRR